MKKFFKILVLFFILVIIITACNQGRNQNKTEQNQDNTKKFWVDGNEEKILCSRCGQSCALDFYCDCFGKYICNQCYKTKNSVRDSLFAELLFEEVKKFFDAEIPFMLDIRIRIRLPKYGRSYCRTRYSEKDGVKTGLSFEISVATVLVKNPEIFQDHCAHELAHAAINFYSFRYNCPNTQWEEERCDWAGNFFWKHCSPPPYPYCEVFQPTDNDSVVEEILNDNHQKLSDVLLNDYYPY